MFETVIFHARRRKLPVPVLRQALIDKAVTVSRERRSPVLLISTIAIPPPQRGATSRLLYRGGRGAVPDEHFDIYEVRAEEEIPDP